MGTMPGFDAEEIEMGVRCLVTSERMG
jgi:hypothetical protein